VNAIAVPLICLVTDRCQLSPGARTASEAIARLESWLGEAIDAVDLIQIRERDLEGRELSSLAGRIAQRARGTRTRVVVNDRADVALSAGVDGVHVRSDGPDVERVRALGGPDWIVGRSVHSQDEVRAHGSADYLLFGTVFPSSSKPSQTPAQGTSALAEAARSTDRPVVAIGGITPARAAACVAAGAAGIAAISLFLPEGRAPGSLGIVRAVGELRAAFGLSPLS
jgi:thiamine-phosphate pyrophosphorylase